MVKTKKYVLTGLMTALVFILTFGPIKIPVPYTTGYIHLGDSMIYLSVLLLGPFLGAFASGVGSMLADLAGGYIHFALPTLVIKALMALIMGFILKGKTKKSHLLAAGSALGVWSLFSAASLIFLQNRLTAMGTGKLVESIAGADAGQEALSETQLALNRLPWFIVGGVAVAIVLLVLAAFIVSRKKGGKLFPPEAFIGMVAAGMLMVMGYYLVECIMYGPLPALFSVGPNLLQFFGGVMVAVILAPPVLKAAQRIQ